MARFQYKFYSNYYESSHIAGLKLQFVNIAYFIIMQTSPRHGCGAVFNFNPVKAWCLVFAFLYFDFQFFSCVIS